MGKGKYLSKIKEQKKKKKRDVPNVSKTRKYVSPSRLLDSRILYSGLSLHSTSGKFLRNERNSIETPPRLRTLLNKGGEISMKYTGTNSVLGPIRNNKNLQ